jgi:hypothetical protein
MKYWFAPLLLLPAVLCARGAEPVRFNRDVRPILSDKCFHCHGPDPKKREADLRLDVREVAVEAKAIVPGKPEESEMIARLLTTDKTDHMPPRKAKLGELTPAEIDLLKRWIAEGAKYEKHWAYLPVGPAAAAANIDALVEKALTIPGLKLQPQADAHTLLRRVTFDVTGLPPTVEEVRAFSSDQSDRSDLSDQAYEQLVDRLLKSPGFGERMAVDWLDVSRYADSYGFQVDREREVWPWRDWVVKAFNENLPFDQFITWQIAGDLLPKPTQEQVLATAFNRLHQQESEGGSVEEEYRVEYVCDRVQTFATAFLGLTFECARCHDHKFDPITQRNYYGLFSIFQNIDEAGLYSFFTQSPPTPTVWLQDAATKERLGKLEAAVREKEAAVETADKEVLREFFGTEFAVVEVQKPFSPASELAGFGFESLDGGKLANWMDGAKPATLKGENKLVPGKLGNAVQFTGDDPVELPIGNFPREQPFSVTLWLQTPDVKDRAVVFHRSRAWTDAASRGYELLIEDGKLKWSLIHFWPGNAISIRTKAAVPVNEWTHVAVTYDGSSRASGLHIYVNGGPAETEVIKDALTKEITGGGGDNITLGERFRDRGFKGGKIDEFRVFTEALGAGGVFGTVMPDPKPGALAAGTPPLHSAERFHQARAELQAARAELYKAQDGVKEVMAMRELPQPKKAFILFRGQYDQRRDEVPAGGPEWLLPWPEGAPRNRLGLAQWLTDPRHPLTARVTVNRIWQSIFGRGLVKTAEDFGSQGMRPVYPEVLDALAAKFIASGWDTKALVKTIVMSKVYRQRSVGDAKLMADDPENELLARGPRFRLSAEMIRDNALAAAGLLSTKTGGPPVNPYEMTEAFKPATPSGGDGVYRRSLYTNWRRTAPPPAMLAFDAPRRAVCAAKRERTDSPLQALILLNGTQYVEAARVLGEKLQRECGGDVARMISAGALRCLSREPDARERSILEQLYERQLAWFREHPAEAAALLKTGNAKAGSDIAAPELAAATVLAQTLMNHDECVVKR